MAEPETLPISRIELERVLWREYQQAIADADTVLMEHRAAVDHVRACSRRWIEAFNRLGGA